MSQESYIPDDRVPASRAFGRMLRQTFEEGYADISDEERRILLADLEQAYSGPPDSNEAPISYQSRQIVDTIMLDEAVRGKDWATAYGTIGPKARSVANLMAFVGIMGSFDLTMDETPNYNPPRSHDPAGRC